MDANTILAARTVLRAVLTAADNRNPAGEEVAVIMSCGVITLKALVAAERFICGFDGDKEGIGELLAEIRAAIAKAEGRS